MAIKVEGPDGQQIEFPEGTDAGVIKSVMQKRYGGPSADAPLGMAAPAPMVNAADDMSTFERARAGYGKFGVDLVQGVKQLGAYTLDQIPLVDLSDYRQGLRDEVAEQRRLDSNLMDTTSGTLGNIAGGLVTLAPLGAAGLAAKGAGALRGILQAGAVGAADGAVMPVAGTDDSERGGNMGIGAALGGGLSALGRGAMGLIEEVAPPFSNLPARVINYFGNKANQTPFAQEGEALAARTGIELTPAQVSGSRAQTSAENIARQSVFSADKAFEADTKVANQTLSYVNRVMDRITRDSLSGEGVGVNVQKAVQEAVQRTAKQREDVARQQYGAIHKALGGKPIVDYSRTREVLDEIANGSGGSLSGDRMRAAEQARELLDRLMRNSGKPGTGMAVPGDPALSHMPPRTLEQAISDRSFWGKAARGDGNLFNDISSSSNRAFARKLYGAIKDDIAAAASKLDGVPAQSNAMVPIGQAGAGGRGSVGLGDALRDADNNYRLYSESLKALEESPMARLLGKDVNVGDFMEFNTLPPETVVTKINAMKPTEVRMMRNFMEANAPDTWQQHKRLIVEDALSKARTAPASAGANTLPLNAGAFIRALGGDKPEKLDQLRAIFKPEEMAEITDALQAARRLGDKFGANFSGTGVYNEVMAAIRDTTVKGVASTAAAAAGLNKIAAAMLNADGRRALIAMEKLPPNSKRANDFAAMLVSIMGATSSARQPLPQDQRMATPAPASATPGTPPPGS